MVYFSIWFNNKFSDIIAINTKLTLSSESAIIEKLQGLLTASATSASVINSKCYNSKYFIKIKRVFSFAW